MRSRTGKFRADVSWSLSIPKRILDIAVAVLVLSLSAVPMLIIALLIRLTSKGPAIFIQTRVGKKGRRFAIYKFRSMTVDTDRSSGPNLTMDGDDRITAGPLATENQTR